MGHVLVVEDDLKTAEELVAALTDHGLTTESTGCSREGLLKAVAGEFDAIVLDRMLPGKLDGLGLLVALRNIGVSTPVLVLSALGTVEERVAGLQSGGDDYMVKPFAFAELTARLDALMRKRTAPQKDSRSVLVLGRLHCDKLTRTARYGGVEIDLLPKEWLLLDYFMRQAGELVTRAMLFEEVWGYYNAGHANVIDVHVSRLRRKLEAAGAPSMIATVRGKGYALHPPE